MTRERAMQIAIRCMEKINPEEWSGKGDPPKSVVFDIYEEQIFDNVVVEVFFVKNDFGDGEDYGYETCVGFVDKDGRPYPCYSCFDGTDDAGGIADMIEYLCDTYIQNGEVVV